MLKDFMRKLKDTMGTVQDEMDAIRFKDKEK